MKGFLAEKTREIDLYSNKEGVEGMGKKMYGRRRVGGLASKNKRWKKICIDSWRTASLEAKIETKVMMWKFGNIIEKSVTTIFLISEYAHQVYRYLKHVGRPHSDNCERNKPVMQYIGIPVFDGGF